jgi:uncharacterized protein YcnI
MRVRIAACIAAAALAFPATASAHVEFSPESVAPGSFTLYDVLSPNESQSQLTGVRITLPEGLEVDSIADTPGFTSELVHDQANRVIGLSWQGGSVDPGHMAVFRFSASVPDTSGTLTATAIQSFADGSSKTWHPTVDVADADGGNSTDTIARALGVLGLMLAAAAIAISLIEMRRKRR